MRNRYGHEKLTRAEIDGRQVVVGRLIKWGLSDGEALQNRQWKSLILRKPVLLLEVIEGTCKLSFLILRYSCMMLLAFTIGIIALLLRLAFLI